MQIDLNNPAEFTLENVRKLLASGDDTTDTQLRVSRDGIAYLSKKVAADDIDALAFRLETWDAGNGYVGPKAAADDSFVTRIFNVLGKNWPNPSLSYIDLF